MVEIITNIDNPRIKYYRSLTQKKFRDKEEKFLIEGIRFVEEALRDDIISSQIEIIIYTEEILSNERNKHLLDRAAEFGVKALGVNSKVFKSLAQTESPQGIIGVIQRQDVVLEGLYLKDNPFLLVVDGVQDPGNLGTIIRTAHAANVDGILLTKGTVDLYNPKVLRSTMGSIFKMKIIKGLENREIIDFLREKSIPIIVADIEDSIKYYEIDYRQSMALVVGNEANGPEKKFIEKADKRVVIPMPGGSESLNVAIAAGIIIYEVVRQRNY